MRDSEERVRFLGYDPANIKLVAYVVAAFFAGIAGALFAPIVGIISPADVGIVPSIAFLIGVAIGGRTTLLGPVLGAIGVAWAQTAVLRAASRRAGPTPRACCSSWSSASSPPGSPDCCALLQRRRDKPRRARPARRQDPDPEPRTEESTMTTRNRQRTEPGARRQRRHGQPSTSKSAA